MNKDFTEIMMINKFLVLFCLLLFALTSEGAKDYNNTFTLGAGGSASDTFIFMNSSGEGRIKWNDATGRMQYTEDTGSTYVDLRDSLRGLTNGPILFGDTDGSVSQDGNNLFYDNTNNRLGLGTGSPNYQLDATGEGAFGGQKVIAGSTGLEIKTNNTLQLYNSADTFKVNVKAPSALASSWTFTVPPNNGTNNFVMKSDGSGNSSWVDPTSVFTGFTSGQLFFGSTSGGFDQDSALVWNDTTKRLGIGVSPTVELDVNGWIKAVRADIGTAQEVVVDSTGIQVKNNKAIELWELTANGSNHVNLRSPADMTVASYDFTFPNDGNEPTGKMLRTNSGGNTYWGGYNDIRSIEGFAISVSVSAGDLIIDVRARDENSFGGSTSTKPAMIGFRNSNVHNSSTIPNFEVVDDKQITIDNLATLGFYDDQVSWVYVYAINNGNTSSGLKIGVSKYPFNDHIPRQYLTTPTTSGNITAVSTSSNSAFYIYSDSALTNTTNYSIKMIGAFKIQKDVSGNLWVNNSAYPVVNGNYESLYKEPLTMRRYVGNGASSMTLPNGIGVYMSLRALISTVDNWDYYNIYTPEAGGVTYNATTGRWDSGGSPTTPANSPHITIPITGYYVINNSYRVRAKNSTAGNQITEYIDKNQVTQGTLTTFSVRSQFVTMDFTSASLIEKSINPTSTHFFNAGDLVYVVTRQEGGSNDASLDVGGNGGTAAWYVSIKLDKEVE